MPKKIVPIKYTSRDFDSIKKSLVDYVKRYYPETYRDFSEASFGSLMLDTVSYVGDVLSFYLDYQANEGFLDTAVEYNNIIRLGKQFGYKFKANPSSYGIATFYILVPSIAEGTAPDSDYIPILKKNSKIKSLSGATFLLDEDVHFIHPNNEVRVARSDEAGLPSMYAIKAHGRVVSGRISEEYVSIGSYKKFLRKGLKSKNIAEILSVIDDEGHYYSEVDYLSQDIVYQVVTNRNSDQNNAPAVLKPFAVPRRFVVERENLTTYLQFGGGSDLEFDPDNIINPSVVDPSKVVLNKHGATHIVDTSFDPYKLVTSDEFGIAPSNTTLRVTLRINTTDDVNSASGSLSEVTEPIYEFKDAPNLDLDLLSEVQSSVEVINEAPITGDVTLPDGVELKRRILDTFSTQDRAVTAKDYESLAYTMPAKLGGIKRCRVLRDTDSFKRNLNMYVISEGSDQELVTPNDTIKQNLKTWILNNKMINDTIDILDAKIINFGVRFEAIGRSDVSKFEILEDAKSALRKHFVRNPEIGEPFLITDVYRILKNVDGLVDVTNVDITLKSGGLYSGTQFSIPNNTSPDGRYIDIPKNCITEIKFLEDDISGVIK
jgi:hypothetical protein